MILRQKFLFFRKTRKKEKKCFDFWVTNELIDKVD